MRGKVLRYIREHGLLHAGERLGVAVSGGADSVVLLHLLIACADLGLNLTVCHIDHALRPESAGDAAFVRGLAESYGLPYAGARLDVRGHAKAHHLSLEMAARDMRYAELNRMAEALGLSHIALGHHRGDQVETMLLRLLRGTGLEGLSGMAPMRADGRFIRPLLALDRAEILAYAAAHGLKWVEDASNRDLKIMRNRVRHELLPGLRRDYNPHVDAALLRLSSLAAEAVHQLGADLAAYWPQLDLRREEGRVSLDAAAVSALPRPLALLALRELYNLAGGDAGRLSLAATERLWRLAAGAAGPRLAVPGGFLGERRAGRCVLSRKTAVPPLPRIEIAGTGRIALPDGRRFCLEWWPGNPPPWDVVQKNEAYVDGDLPVWPLAVRGRCPGDRMHPLGLTGGKKIKELLIEAKIPRDLRPGVPLLVDAAGRVIWLAGLRVDDRFRVTEGTRRVLRLCLLPATPGGHDG